MDTPAVVATAAAPVATRAEKWTAKQPRGCVSVQEYNRRQRQQWNADYEQASKAGQWTNMPQLAMYLFFNQRSIMNEERKTGYIAWAKFELHDGTRAVWGKTKKEAIARLKM